MRVPNQRQLEQPWHIHDIVEGFRLEDVWSLPEINGTADDFEDAIALMAAGDPASSPNPPTRFLWKVRDALGRWLNLGRVSEPVAGVGQLVARVPAELRGTADEVRFERLPFTVLYKTADEFAAEISNKTVHGVMHLGWVSLGNGTYRGQLAVYVKPRGVLGSAYMAFIKPFRYLIVYPAVERELAAVWANRHDNVR